MRALRESNLPISLRSGYLEEGTSDSLLKALEKAFSGLASDIRCYFAFCELKGIRPLPPRGRYVAQWSTFFKDGATYRQYVNSLRKVCYILHPPLDWSTGAVCHAAYGLRLDGGSRIRLPNFIRIGLIWRLVAHFEDEDEFYRLSFIASLFASRAPSDALLLQRALRRGVAKSHFPSPRREMCLSPPLSRANQFWRPNLRGDKTCPVDVS